MSKIYQTRKGDASRVPRNVYLVCLYLLRDVERMIDEISKTTKEDENEHYTELTRIANAIGDAYDTIPEPVYRFALYKHFTEQKQIRFLAYEYSTSEKTLSRWKSWLIYTVAKNLNLI